MQYSAMRPQTVAVGERFRNSQDIRDTEMPFREPPGICAFAVRMISLAMKFSIPKQHSAQLYASRQKQHR
jgi:hypothetical protein